MIKNVVFDFGQVLVHFEPDYMVTRYVEASEDAELLSKVIFDRLYWDRLDEGTITDEEVVRACIERLPERLHRFVSTIYYNWIYNIPEMEGMSELIDHIKERYGVRVYLLSNISRYFAEHREEVPVLSKMDQCFFSALCGCVKPHRAIFEHLCKEGQIVPEETLFVDDNLNNIKGAEEVGITGYCFDGDADALRTYLDRLLT